MSKNRSVTKVEIIKGMSEITGDTQKTCAQYYEAFIEVFQNEILKNKNDVKLRDFGTFSIVHSPARTYNNVRKGVQEVSKSSHKLKFTPAKILRETLKEWE